MRNRVPGCRASAVHSGRRGGMLPWRVRFLPRIAKLHGRLRRLLAGTIVRTVLPWLHERGKHRGTAAPANRHPYDDAGTGHPHHSNTSSTHAAAGR